MKHLSIRSGILIACIVLLIFRLSLQDAPTSNTLSKQVTQTVNTILQQIGLSESIKAPTNNFIRDLAHFSLFFVLGLICICVLLFQHLSLRRSTCLTLFLGAITAWIDEIIQIGSPGRAFEWIDMEKDLLGVCVSIVLVNIIVLIFRCFKPKL